MRILSILLLLAALLDAKSIARKYPSYNYVFSEFDVESSFIENDTFVRFVKRNERMIKRFYARSIKRGEMLMPLLQRKLMSGGLSDLLIYLSMVESGFSIDAVSSKKAAGLWQFMPSTAKSYKLTVSKDIDERYDPTSSTDAAIAYLEKLYEQFGKWYLAVMAYNCGEGRLSRAINYLGTDNLEVLISDSSPLPLETRRYIQKILLAAMIGEGISLGFYQMSQEKEGNGIVRVIVNARESWSHIAQVLDMNLAELRQLNPAYKGATLPEKKSRYSINIPEEKIYAFYLRYELQKHSTLLQMEYMLPYEVKLGDTLEKIAAIYHTDPESIKMANHKAYEYLEVGELLIVPVSKEDFEKHLSENSK